MATENTETDKKQPLLRASLRLEGLRSFWHDFCSFETADGFVRGQCETLFPDDEQTVFYRAEWEGGNILQGCFPISASDSGRDSILRDAVQAELQERSLMPTGTKDEKDFLRMVNSPEWQFSRLTRDPGTISHARHLLLSCEGFDADSIQEQLALLDRAIATVDDYHPLLHRIFPCMADRLAHLRPLDEDESPFAKTLLLRVGRAIRAAVEDNEDAFEKAQQDVYRMADKCVEM